MIARAVIAQSSSNEICAVARRFSDGFFITENIFLYFSSPLLSPLLILTQLYLYINICICMFMYM